ncbi:MAG: hypothetical protein RLY43_985, partial [Bacteroidota bacterium]
MKTKFGSIIVAGSGKIGGHVAAKNRSGSYIRTKVTPVNPNTSAQAAVRSRLVNFSQAWRGLTAAQRASWNGAVGDYKKTNIFGDLVNPSGFNLYQRLNNNLSQVGAAAISVPPLPAAVGYLPTLSVVVDNSASSVTLTFAPAIGVNQAVKLSATAPMSAGKNFVKSEFRQIAILDNTDVSPYVASADYIAKFGSVG